MIDTLRLTAEEAAGLLERGEVSGEELSGAYLDAIEARDPELHAYLHVAGERGRRRPDRPQGRDHDEGHPDHGRLEDPRRLHARSSTRPSPPAARRRACPSWARPTWTSSPWARPPRTRPSGRRATPGIPSAFRAAPPAARPPPSPAGSRPGRSAPTPAAPSSSRPRSAAWSACARRTAPSRATGSSRSRRASTRSGPLTKTVRDNALLYPIIAGKDPLRLDDRRAARAGRDPRGRGSEGRPHRRPEGDERSRGHRPGRERARQRGDRASPRSSGPRSGRRACRARSTTGSPATTSSRRPRRARTSPATTASATATAPTADGDLHELYSRTRWEGFGAEPKRRILLGTYALSAGYYDAYYGQAQKVRTVIAQEHAAAFERFDVLVSPTSPTVAFRIGEKAENPLAMYLSDLLTIPLEHGRPARPLDPVRALRGPAGRAAAASARSSRRTLLFRVGHALEQALGFDYVPERLRDELGSRSSAWRSTSS